MSKRIEPPKASNVRQPLGLDDGSTPPLDETNSPVSETNDVSIETNLVPAETASPDVVETTSGPLAEVKDDREYGRLEFQPKCEACSNQTESDVRMVQYRAAGPIAYYRCPRCDKRIKHGRPWQPKNPFGQAPNVAARPDMQ